MPYSLGLLRLHPMIDLHHCVSARSFRPLWLLEELGIPYRLHMLPFPPRVHARDYLARNPLGTVPLLEDGATRLTELAAMCHYLATRYGAGVLDVAPADAAYGSYLNWLFMSDATLTFPQTLVLRYSYFEPPDRLRPTRWRRTTHAGSWRGCGRWMLHCSTNHICVPDASLPPTSP